MTHEPLSGVFPALITPFCADGTLDRVTLADLVERAAAAGVTGFAPCGSTGEGWHLLPATRRAVLTTVLAHSPVDLSVLCWVPANDLETTLSELEDVAEAGATAALLAPPVAGTEQSEFVTALADRAPLPLVLYNIPALSGVAVETETILRLADHPRVIGVKDSTRDMENLQRWIWATEGADGFSVLTGADSLLVSSLLTGAAGTIAASPGVLPQLAVGIHRAVVDGDLETAWARQRELAAIVDLCRAHAFPAGWKVALHLLGYGSGRPAPSREGLDEQAVGELREQLQAFPAFTAAQRSTA
ncbi:dihydrodipicolinate synthase family protein [Brachybacterium sp. GCM10030252]|uniref:dihydrodipicolinate synthase family protein n=1 Tax=Brachybacterium sp. GCM10030252 TaxID=3273380 RepID=UPI003623CB50